MKDVILKLYKTAKTKNWKPWELQSELRKIYDGVIAVGDDLSFTIKLEKDLRNVDLNGERCKIYPFNNAYRFNKGYIAFEGRFLRVSRDIDEKLLEKILDAILPEG